jgi:hypothetical protein
LPAQCGDDRSRVFASHLDQGRKTRMPLQQRQGAFFSKNASLREIRGFYDVVNLDDATLKEYTK